MLGTQPSAPDATEEKRAFFVCVYPSYIQLTPQMQSAEWKNPPGAPGAGESGQKTRRGIEGEENPAVLLIMMLCSELNV